MTFPPFPAQNSGDWYAWAQAVDGSARNPATGSVTTIVPGDDLTAINAKLAVGGIVIWSPGTYNVSGELYLYSSTPTWVQAAGATVVSTYNDAIMRVNNAAHIIDGLTITGAGTAQDNQCGILTYAPNSVIRNCTITNLARFAVYVSDADGSQVLGNVIDSCSLGTQTDSPSVASIFVGSANHVVTFGNRITNAYWGITYRGNSATDPIIGGLCQGNYLRCRDSIRSSNPLLGGNGAQGLSGSYARHQRMIDNHIDNFPSNSIDNYGCWYNLIRGNSCSNGGGDGVFVGHQGTHSVVIEGNSVYACATGVRVWDTASYVTVANNVIDACTYAGIQARGAINTGDSPINNITITGNQINGENGATVNSGIWLSNLTVGVVANNQVNRPAKEGIRGDSCQLVRVTGNVLQDSGYGTSNGYDGVLFDAASGLSFVNSNLFYGSAKSCVHIAGGNDSQITGNRFRVGTGITGITDAGNRTVQSDNVTV